MSVAVHCYPLSLNQHLTCECLNLVTVLGHHWWEEKQVLFWWTLHRVISKWMSGDNARHWRESHQNKHNATPSIRNPALLLICNLYLPSCRLKPFSLNPSLYAPVRSQSSSHLKASLGKALRIVTKAFTSEQNQHLKLHMKLCQNALSTTRIVILYQPCWNKEKGTQQESHCNWKWWRAGTEDRDEAAVLGRPQPTANYAHCCFSFSSPAGWGKNRKKA